MSLIEKMQGGLDYVIDNYYKHKIRKLTTSGKIPISGFAYIELEQNNGRVRRKILKNSITNPAKRFIMQLSLGNILGNLAATLYGKTYTIQNIMDYYESTYRGPRNLKNLKLYLINLSTVTIDSDTQFLNVFDSNLGVDATKVIGYADNKVTSAIATEGIIDSNTGTYMIDKDVIAQRWLFDTGVATGEFNKIVMAPEFSELYGLVNFRCITRVNKMKAVYEITNGYVIPGVTGITGTGEILLNYNDDGTTRHIYNLTTGVTTDLTAGDGLKYTLTMYADELYSQLVYGDYLYMLTIAAGGTPTIRKINMSTGAETDTITLGDAGSLAGGMYINDSGQLVVTVSDKSQDNASEASSRIATYNISGTGIALSGSIAYLYNYAGIGGLPTGYYKNGCTVRKVNGYFYVYCKGRMFKCTSLTDIKGSLVKVFPCKSNTDIFYTNGKVYLIMRGVYNYSSTGSQAAEYYMNEATVVESNLGNEGVWVCEEADTTNIFSGINLDTPVTKGATDKMYVTYYYKII